MCDARKTKSILLIGASSFIGVYTVDALLDAGYEVVATGRNQKFKQYYANKGVTYLCLDISQKENFNILPSKKIDACILLAGLLPANDTANLSDEDHAEDYVNVNTLGTINVINYCRKKDISRIISATSYSDVFNAWNKDVPFTEETPRDFKFEGDHCEYIISKNAATDFLFYFNAQYGMKNIVFRFPPVYGVGPHGSLLENGKIRKSGIQIFIDLAKEGKPINVYGDKNVKRDIVYVKDVADAYVKALESNAEGLYNIGSGETISLEEQAKAIAEVFSKPAVSIFNMPEKNNGIKSYCMSIEKAKQDFGYSPRFTSFLDMMKDWKMEEERGEYLNIFS